MMDVVTINSETCKVCGLCEDICPIRIMENDTSSRMSFRRDRLHLCIKCGQCMAICPTRSVVVDGLDYSRDFFSMPKGELRSLAWI